MTRTFEAVKLLVASRLARAMSDGDEANANAFADLGMAMISCSVDDEANMIHEAERELGLLETTTCRGCGCECDVDLCRHCSREQAIESQGV